MRILIVSDTYYPHVNGASYFTQRLAHYLSAAGHTVAVVAPGETAHDEKSVSEDGVTLYGLRSLGVFFYKGFRFCPPFFLGRHIKKILDEFRPDVVHIQNHFIIARPMVALAKKMGIPIVATNHFMPDNLIHYMPLHRVFGKTVMQWAWHDMARIFSNVKAVTTPTQTAAGLIQHHLPMSVRPISCGIDLEQFRPGDRGQYLRKRYKIPDKLILLYVGRLDREKNLDFVLMAMNEALRKVDFHFVIAGTGAERGRLEALVRQLALENNVTFAGFVPDADLPNLYTTVHCFVSPGSAELQSIVTMEAMASSLPVVAVNAVALPELVHDGKNGFLFELNDMDALAAHLRTIFSDAALRKKMGAESLKIIAAHDIHKTVAAYEKLYQEVLTPQRA